MSETVQLVSALAPPSNPKPSTAPKETAAAANPLASQSRQPLIFLIIKPHGGGAAHMEHCEPITKSGLSVTRTQNVRYLTMGVAEGQVESENRPMPRVRVEPLDIEFEAPLNETVMDAANAAGYWWPVGCNRNGECTNCAMDVVSGVGRLSRMGRFERANLLRQRGRASIEDPRLRLACQARIEGDVVVYKLGVRPDTL